jgi:hypothetical protein
MDQLNARLRELAEQAYKTKKEVVRDTGFADQEKLLLDNGWRRRQDDFIGVFWKMPDNECSVQMQCAFEMEWQNQQRRKRKEDIENYSADVFCNKCGKDMRVMEKSADGKEFCVGYYGLVDAVVSGGYESTALNDCTIYTFCLCEKCLMDLFAEFKILPQIDTYL